MTIRPLFGGLFLLFALAPAHAQTDHLVTPATRAIAVYEWTGDLEHPISARLIPISLFLHGQLHDAGEYLPEPIPFALQPGTVYLLQRAGHTLGGINIQSAHTSTTPSAPAWAAYGAFLTPSEAIALTAPHPAEPILPSTTNADIPSAPKSSKKSKPTRQQAYITAPTTPLLDDPDRPTLQSGPASTSITPHELTNLPANLHQLVAISDAATHTPEDFTYTWPSSATRDQTLAALEALALPHLTHYIAFNKLASAPANSPGLTNAQLLAFTLAPGTSPTYVLTAESPIPDGGPIYLTVIAQPNFSGQITPKLISMTDSSHLDRTPRFIAIDAVDPDATGRADILFGLRSQGARHFALYTGSGQQVFLTALAQ